jgi:Fe2+ or Zn2+ uptake regulation protein
MTYLLPKKNDRTFVCNQCKQSVDRVINAQVVDKIVARDKSVRDAIAIEFIQICPDCFRESLNAFL